MFSRNIYKSGGKIRDPRGLVSKKDHLDLSQPVLVQGSFSLFTFTLLWKVTLHRMSLRPQFLFFPFK